MTLPSFVSSFAGAALSARTATSPLTPRCAMQGDFEAPKIAVIPGPTKADGTVDEASCKLKVYWETVASPLVAAGTVTGNSALLASLKPGTATGSPTVRSAKPDGVAPADWYFPKDMRDKAPVISMEYNSKVSVSFDEINPLVGGTSAKPSVAFWKQKTYKYTEADLPAPNASTADPIETAAFEKYFPTSRRYFAPGIEMRPPTSESDSTAYLIVKNEYVRINAAAARALDLPGQDANDAEPAGVMTGRSYFGDDSKAPVITIGKDSVSVAMESITAPEEKAEGFRMSPLYQASVAEK